MLSHDQEQQIRQTVRRSLENILGEKHDGSHAKDGMVADAKDIIADETERYYERLGMVKHISRSGQVHWVTPEERDRLQVRRRRQRGVAGWWTRLNPRVALVWSLAIFIAVVLVAYLVHTVSVAGLVD